MILVDTTVLVYAIGNDHRLREPCRKVVDAIGDRHLHATTTVEVIQEFTHVFARRRSRHEATSAALNYVDLFTPLERPSEDDLRIGLSIYRSNDRVGAFDAVLAAVSIDRAHVTALVSADRGFADVHGLVHVDPSDPEAIERLLSD